jgi:hypothetical protein
LFLSALLFLGANSAIAGEECPASLMFQVPKLGAQDRQIAQRYANCVSVPWLPASEELSEKLAGCRATLPARQSDALEKSIQWVDHIASGFGTCETSLEIKAKT